MKKIIVRNFPCDLYIVPKKRFSIILAKKIKVKNSIVFL